MYSNSQLVSLESCAISVLRLPKRKWNAGRQKRNTGWQKQRNGSNSGNLFTHSKKLSVWRRLRLAAMNLPNGVGSFGRRMGVNLCVDDVLTDVNSDPLLTNSYAIFL